MVTSDCLHSLVWVGGSRSSSYELTTPLSGNTDSTQYGVVKLINSRMSEETSKHAHAKIEINALAVVSFIFFFFFPSSLPHFAFRSQVSSEGDMIRYVIVVYCTDEVPPPPSSSVASRLTLNITSIKT